MSEWKTYTENIEEYEESLSIVNEGLASETCSYIEERLLEMQKVSLIKAIAALRPYAEREQKEEESKCQS